MKVEKKYSGVVVPMVTPFNSNFSIDENAVAKIMQSFEYNNVQPFILGTTGEAASIPIALQNDLIKIAAKNKTANTILYAGISSNSTLQTIENANFCADNNVDVVVATVPAYFALTNSQIINYFETLANKSNLPVIIYNIPATTNVSLNLEILDELSKHPNIVGIKDSERSEERLTKSIALWKDRNECSFLIGWAAKSAEGLLVGADGIIPSTGNLTPKLYNDLYFAAQKKDAQTTYALQKLSDEIGATYQSNRTLGESLKALKMLMKENGLCEDYMMPPL